MPVDLTQLIIQGGIGAVLFAAMVMFIRYIQGRDRADAVREERTEKFLTNHLSTYARSMDAMAKSVRELASEVSDMRHAVERYPDQETKQ